MHIVFFLPEYLYLGCRILLGSVNGGKHLFLSRTSDNGQHADHISQVHGRHGQSMNIVQQAVGL